MDVLAQVAAHTPHIATQDSGVSWGALLAILGVIGTIGAASVTLLFNYIKSAVAEIKTAVAEIRKEQKALYDKLDAKIEKTEVDSRSARANQWQEHNALRDKVVTMEATIAAMRTATSVHGNPAMQFHDTGK